MLRRLFGVTVAVALVVPIAVATAAQDVEKQVYVTVLASDGVPVTGMTVEHFAIREGGQDRTVLKVEPLRVPMHVAVLVDTSVANGVLDEPFRTAVTSFVESLASFNNVAVYASGDRAVKVIGFTQDAPKLRSAVATMFGWQHQRSFLVDAIDLALTDLQVLEPKRPVIIAITSENPEASGRSAGGVIKRLIAQSTAFHALSLAVGTTATASKVTNDIPTSSQRLGGMMAAGQGDRERTQALQQGTTATGGSRQRVTTTLAVAQALQRLHSELANSYVVTFARKGSDKIKDLQVGVMVDGVTLRATAAPFGTR